jgi:hypothetical protein
MPGKELPLRHPSGPRGQDDWGRAEKLPKNPPSGSSQSFRDRPTRAYSTKGVVVANHASHADTAVLLAALLATHSGLSTHLPCVAKKCPLACDASGGHV